MKVLPDTNIIIHREATIVINEDIGVLFRWLDKLRYEKCIHPLTISEIEKNKDSRTVKTLRAKMESYYVLKTQAKFSEEVRQLSDEYDKTDNDVNDTRLLNEVFAERVDILITEDRRIHKKANQLAISSKVLYIDSFIERAIAEHPKLLDYKIQSVRQELFGNIDLNDEFFDSFKSDYFEFERWYSRKSDETAYICYEGTGLAGFLYLKQEYLDEDYSDIQPAFVSKKRLKIGTFKVTLNGFKIGERFLKVIFDNALHLKVEEIYVTIFNKSIEQKRLIRLLEQYGFVLYGHKTTNSGVEEVYIRDFTPMFDYYNPQKSFPFISVHNQAFLVPIYPASIQNYCRTQY